jgi:hypothetical protein
MDMLSTVAIIIVVIVVLAIGYYVMKPEKR